MVVRLLGLCFSLRPYAPIQGFSQQAGSFLVQWSRLRFGLLFTELELPNRDCLETVWRLSEKGMLGGGPVL